MLSFVPHHFKTKKKCKYAVKKIPFLIRYVPDQYKTQQMSDKAVDTDLSATQFVPECYKTQEMCYKGVHRGFLYFILFLIYLKPKKHVTFLYISF